MSRYMWNVLVRANQSIHGDQYTFSRRFVPLSRGFTSIQQQEEWMREALVEARTAMSANEVPIGAILVKENKIIGRGQNRQIRSNDSGAHAEINAIRDALTRTNLSRLDGCNLIVTVEPCIMCLGTCLLYHVDTIIFGTNSPKFGACGGAAPINDLLSLHTPPLNHTVKILGGCLSDECADLITKFFRTLRDSK